MILNCILATQNLFIIIYQRKPLLDLTYSFKISLFIFKNFMLIIIHIGVNFYNLKIKLIYKFYFVIV